MILWIVRRPNHDDNNKLLINKQVPTQALNLREKNLFKLSKLFFFETSFSKIFDLSIEIPFSSFKTLLFS